MVVSNSSMGAFALTFRSSAQIDFNAFAAEIKELAEAVEGEKTALVERTSAEARRARIDFGGEARRPRIAFIAATSLSAVLARCATLLLRPLNLRPGVPLAPALPRV